LSASLKSFAEMSVSQDSFLKHFYSNQAFFGIGFVEAVASVY